MKTASWIVMDKATEQAVFETFSESVAAKINTQKYIVFTAPQWLQSINRECKINN